MRPGDPRLRSMLRPARTSLLGVLVAGGLSGLLVLAQAWTVTGLVVAVLRGNALLPWVTAVVGVLALRGLTSAAGDLSATRAAANVGTVLRHRLVRAATEQRATAVSTTTASDAAVLATRGVTAAEPYLTRYLPALVLAVLLPPLTVVAIATQDLLSAAIVVSTLPLVPIFGALVGLATRDRAEEQWRAMTALSGHFLDVVRGLPTLVAHRRARAQSARIAEVTDHYRRATMRTLRIAFASSAVLELVATLSVALVAVTVGVRLAGGSLDLHTALLVLLLAPEAYWPLRRVGAEFHAAAEGAATFTAAHDLLTTAGPVEAIDRPAPVGAPLVLDRVRVIHPGRTVPALDLVDVVLPARGVTAITGPSGCGKSTMLSAIAGLVPLSSGSISSGGQQVGGVSWQSQVARLPQQPQFVGGTIADNLRLARAAAAEAQLWAALREVALEERVRDLPAGLDTPLGEDGATLSAGERARLALARVVLADRPWVLLDEPTAHLDDLTEQVIADTVVALGRRSGVVVVAHSPRLVEAADRTVVLRPPVAETTSTSTRPDGPARGREPVAHANPIVAPMGQDRPGHTGRALASATVVGALASASGVALTATAGWLIVQASTRPAVLTLLVAVVGVRAFGLARPVLRYVERLLGHDAALRLLARRRVEVYDVLVPLVPGGLDRRRGDVLSSIVDDVDSVIDSRLRVRMPLAQLAMVAVLATAVAAYLHPPSSVFVAAATLVGGAAYLLARHGARRAENDLISLRASLSIDVVEAVQLADELVMWQQTIPAADRIAATSARMGAAARVAAGWLAAARATVLVVCGGAMAGIALVAAGPVERGDLSGPVMALLVLLPLALADVALPCADAGVVAVRAAAADRRLMELERIPAAVADVPGSATPSGHRVELDQVSARWSLRAPTTAPVCLLIEQGDRVAVVGPSGSGKSTLAAVLMRFLDPCSGRVSIGGASLPDVGPDDVRRIVGLVDDHPHVFATTVAENVRLARPDASDAEVDAALRDARLGPWLDALPDGLHTWLGAGHSAVSGGERARLGIARTLLADHPVLVLDEPTAHLDHATATALARELLGTDRGRSVIWITHGTAGLDLVDRTIALEVASVARAQGPVISRASARGPDTTSSGG
ncbi:thiol reductant ABC exporter subunit CydD [Nocardioides sp. Root190]|uniref:thiol reductant ABC exporter subunit CydD n=1 Tax=Nocardioides sp. Root190 TaxID=1736488 RepID=UPI0009EA92D3|nr:thiol reductant ABC exporter subunit CydD [Nocardioides sp. Root190]